MEISKKQFVANHPHAIYFSIREHLEKIEVLTIQFYDTIGLPTSFPFGAFQYLPKVTVPDTQHSFENAINYLEKAMELVMQPEKVSSEFHILLTVG